MLSAVWRRLCEIALRRLSAREAGKVVQAHSIWLAGRDPRLGQYAVDFNNPQALRFLIDVYPDLVWVFSQFPRDALLHFLDIGPAFGSAAGLLYELHQSAFLGPRLRVDVLDLTDDRRRYIDFRYPQISFHCGSIGSIPVDQRWDVTYCSNVLEHIEEPTGFVDQVLRHTSGYALFVAPYRECQPRSLDHKSSISEDTFSPYQVERMRVFETAAWPMTADGVERRQIMAIVRA